MTLIFDLDDTLYDRCAPFVKALEMALGKEIPGNKREWYHIYSICSQEMFEAQARGEVSLADSRILRIRKAMKYFEVPFSEEQEQVYQDAYAKEQGNVWMSDTIKELMDLGMQMGTTMAVLTNGPVDHQLKKAATLHLENWIPREKLFISEEIGYTKPDVGAFHCVERVLNQNPGELWKIGDSFSSDMEGAKKAGWKTIWLNKNLETVPEGKEAPDYIAQTEEELLEIVKILVMKERKDEQ